MSNQSPSHASGFPRGSLNGPYGLSATSTPMPFATAKVSKKTEFYFITCTKYFISCNTYKKKNTRTN